MAELSIIKMLKPLVMLVSCQYVKVCFLSNLLWMSFVVVRRKVEKWAWCKFDCWRYLYSPSGPSWLVLAGNLHYLYRYFFFCALTAPFEPRPPPCGCFKITHWYSTLARTPLDERSALRRDLYLTTRSVHKRQTSMPQAGFEPAISASERQQNAYTRIIKWRFGTNPSSSLSKKSIISD